MVLVAKATFELKLEQLKLRSSFTHGRCRGILWLTPSNRKAFIVKPGHQVRSIEKIVKLKDEYSVIEKYKVIAEPSSTLNNTPTNNT